MYRFLPFLLLLATNSYSQDPTIKTLQSESGKTIKKEGNDSSHWKTGGLLGLNIAQGSLSNWAAGGDNFSLSLNSLINLFAFHKKNRTSWDNVLDIHFGYVNTTSLGSRKNDDRFDFLSKYGYAFKPKTSIAGLFNFRTQMTKGYDYPANAPKVLFSDFLSPAYILLSLGLDFKPIKDLSIFVSPLTSRWLIVKNDTLSAKGAYGVPLGKHSKNEIGAFATINYMVNLNKRVSYKGRLDLFSNYKHNPEKVDLFMTNIFATSLSKVLSASWNFDLIYDDDVRMFGKTKDRAALQLKSLIGVGLMVKLNNKS